nr:hypothetical protein [Haladaptatus sp. W1]
MTVGDLVSVLPFQERVVVAELSVTNSSTCSGRLTTRPSGSPNTTGGTVT